MQDNFYKALWKYLDDREAIVVSNFTSGRAADYAGYRELVGAFQEIRLVKAMFSNLMRQTDEELDNEAR